MAGQTINVSILADTKQFSSAMRKLSDESGLSRLGTMTKQAGKAIAVGLAAGATAAAAFGAKAVSMASDLEQSIGGVDAVFKDTAGQVHNFAKEAAGAVGLSKNSYNELATIIGTTLKNSGTPMKELAGATDDLIARSADLAATFGGPVTESSNAVASALRGEFEPLRRYGVALDQASINARAMADSGKANAAELTKQEKALATQALIMEQSKDAAGAFARESNTLAGQTERLKAKLENLGASVGTVLLPVLTSMVEWISNEGLPKLEQFGTWAQENILPALSSLGTAIQDQVLPHLQTFGTFLTDTVVPKLQEFGTYITETVVPALQDAGTWIQNNRGWLEPLAVTIGTIVLAWTAYVKVMALWKAATALATAAQVALNLALTANPIGIIIALVAGLVAGLIYLWNTNEGFRDAVIAVWNTIKGGVAAVLDWFGGLPATFRGYMDSVSTAVSNGVTAVVDFFRGLPGKAHTAVAPLVGRLRDKAQEALTALKDKVTSGISDAVGFFRDLPGKITGALGDLSGLLSNAGRQVIDGFLGALRGGFDRVKSELGRLTSLLPSWKGPPARDRNILKGAGQLVIGGFIAGMESEYGNVKRSLAGLTDTVATTSFAAPAFAPDPSWFQAPAPATASPAPTQPDRPQPGLVELSPASIRAIGAQFVQAAVEAEHTARRLRRADGRP